MTKNKLNNIIKSVVLSLMFAAIIILITTAIRYFLLSTTEQQRNIEMKATFDKYVTAILKKANLPDSPAFHELSFMIAAHESGGFTYVRQLNGPALGLFQEEPATFYDVKSYAAQKGYVYPESPEELVLSFDAAIVACRVFFLRISQHIPDASDVDGLAAYAKKYWNTEGGKATVGQYKEAYLKYRNS